MKASELMIGDWVQDITPCVIDAISNEDICTYRNVDGYITANPSNLKPIPLTAEILEKNGFERRKLDGGAEHFVFADDYYDIVVYEWSDSIWVFRYESCELTIPHEQRTMSYLHQFQHAFHDCGIDKEIVL